MPAARSLVGLVGLTGIVLLLTAAGLGAESFTIAAIVAFVPLPLYLGIALWLDRFEPEPRAMLLMAFLWGASVAVVVSGILNGIMDEAVGELWSAVATAPVIEELLKGYILFRFYAKRKDEFDGVIDGLIYAAMVGLGFAFAENIDYYGRALVKEGPTGLAVTFTLRGLLGAFSHPLFTGLTGVGLGLARQSSRRWVRRLAPPTGLIGAIALHSLWNAGASAGLIFFGIYAVVMLPALAVLFVVAALALKFEGRLIRAHLAGEAAAGVFTAAEYAQLCSVRGRLHASSTAFRRGGFAAWRRQRDIHQAASELAFLRRRAERDRVAKDAALEAAYLSTLGVAPAPAVAPDAHSNPFPDATADLSRRVPAEASPAAARAPAPPDDETS